MTLHCPSECSLAGRFVMVLGEQDWDRLFPGLEPPITRRTAFGIVEHVRSDFIQELPMTILTLNDVPDTLFPIRIAQAYNRQCGWWITTDDSGLAGRRGYPVRYCSLTPGHVDNHVWRTPPIDFGNAQKEAV